MKEEAYTPIPLHYKDETIFYVEVNGELWFSAREICRILGYSGTTAIAIKLKECYYRYYKTLTSYGRQTPKLYINKAGLSTALNGSRKQGSAAFLAWILALPAGNIPDPKTNDPAQVMPQSQIEEMSLDELYALGQKIFGKLGGQPQPKSEEPVTQAVIPLDDGSCTKVLYTVKDAAAEISKVIGKTVKFKKLYRYLREKGLMVKDGSLNVVAPEYTNSGYFMLGSSALGPQKLCITQAGLQHIIEMLRADDEQGIFLPIKMPCVKTGTIQQQLLDALSDIMDFKSIKSVESNCETVWITMNDGKSLSLSAMECEPDGETGETN